MVNSEDPDVIYLIDFGLASRFLENSAHINYKEGQTFSGNMMFGSSWAFRGVHQTRRDDIESLMLLMIHLLNDGTLPWVVKD